MAPSLAIFLKAQVLYGAFRRDAQEGHYELAMSDALEAAGIGFPFEVSDGRSSAIRRRIAFQKLAHLIEQETTS